MKQPIRQLMVLLCLFNSSVFAETNAVIEVKLFKDWIIKGEVNCGNFNLAIKNTGTDPILLATTPFHFEIGQLATRPFPHIPNEASERKQEQEYQMIVPNDGEFFSLLPEETHVYEGRKFYLPQRLFFSEEIRFTVSIYLGKGFWLDSDPVTLNGVVPASEEKVATLTDVNGSCDLVTVTYKNQRWLYSKTPKGSYFEICPVSPASKIRVEPHEGKGLYKLWDGDKPMVYWDRQSIIIEGPDENDVLGKWTRERKRKADADNAEVRRRKADGKGK